MEKEIQIQDYTVSGLYYRYKKTSDEDILKYLERIAIARIDNHGVGSVHGYYPISSKSLKKIKENPRGQSLTFDAHEIGTEPLTDLVPFKRITFLVKSTSRFFLKPDVGEIFDQIDFRDLLGNKIKAISMDEGYVTLEGTEGEHFLMTATLLTTKEYEKQKAIEQLHELNV